MCDQLAQECIVLITEGYYFIQRLDGNKMLSSETRPVRERVFSSITRNWKVITFKVLLPTDVQENCFKRSIKTYTKKALRRFGVITIIRERTKRAC
jgi:hypothetical protein